MIRPPVYPNATLSTENRQPGENYISNFFHVEWDMIVGTVFLLILNQMEIHLVQNRMENCHHEHISFNMKGNIVFSMNLTASIVQVESRHGLLFSIVHI